MVEIYIVPSILKVIDFVRNNKEVREIMSYFEREGYSSGIAQIQNMSFIYVNLCCELLEIGSAIKPFRVYQGY